MTISISGTTGITLAGQFDSASTFSFKNRIINGGMVIDQRNAGASVTATTTGSLVYTVDRWAYYADQASKFTVQQNAGSVTPPTGFINYLGVTSSSAYTVGSAEAFGIDQNIEGLNVSDFGWGSASAATVTFSFWVRSSLTGAFGGSFRNSASNRSYPFTYSISAANTWEQKTITIVGDTSGTWLTTNGIGIRIWFSIGAGSTFNGTVNTWSSGSYLQASGATSVVGTSGATFYITGVQLEKGSTATSFDYRPYGTELALCQRYFVQYNASSGSSALGLLAGISSTTTQGLANLITPVVMRTTPSIVIGSGNSNFLFQAATSAASTSTTIVVSSWYQNNIYINLSGFTAVGDGLVSALSIRNTLTVSSEL
jgi:hypothetical protein